MFRSHYDPLVTGEGDVFIDYPEHEAPRDPNIPYFVSEFGGTFYDPDEETEPGVQAGTEAWGYGDAPRSRDAFYARFEGLVTALLDNPKICGFCYTQLTDVMQEQNGVFRFDRSPKFDADRLRAVLTRKAAIEDQR